jgi:hypothetical protein
VNNDVGWLAAWQERNRDRLQSYYDEGFAEGVQVALDALDARMREASALVVLDKDVERQAYIMSVLTGVKGDIEGYGK